MSRFHTSAYPSPLKGYKNAPPLPVEKNEGGKSFKNNQTGIFSEAYSRFPAPIIQHRNGFDCHIYYFQTNPTQKKFAHELWQRIRHEFPELMIYTFWEQPVGPHPIAMFEVCITTPRQFGAFWLIMNRGPLSALIHPNTTKEEEVDDHTYRGTWLGQAVILDIDCFHSGRD